MFRGRNGLGQNHTLDGQLPSFEACGLENQFTAWNVYPCPLDSSNLECNLLFLAIHEGIVGCSCSVSEVFLTSL